VVSAAFVPLVRHLAFSAQFRGHATWLSPGVLVARATAPSSALVTQFDSSGIHGVVEERAGGEAHLECRLTFNDASSFEEVGTVSFGNGHALRFRSLRSGVLEASADPHLWHGADTWRIDGGAGALAGAVGRIVSNFLVSDSGDLTDHQLALVFLSADPGAERALLPRELGSRSR
jgi:hypothetical protein